MVEKLANEVVEMKEFLVVAMKVVGKAVQWVWYLAKM